LTVKPQPVKTIVPDIPDILDALVLKCIEKDKNNRYSTAGDIISDLKVI